MSSYTIDFDFTLSAQRKILKKLQSDDAVLLGYKGAEGPGQVSTYLPTWFAIPARSMYGKETITYTPAYKVYVFQKSTVGPNTVVTMDVLSDAVELGTQLTFNEDGTFSSGTAGKAGVISVLNDRPASTPTVIIGLAAKVNGVYKPFCAFKVPPQNAVSMAPREKVCLFFGETDMHSGSVLGNTTAPGCTFKLNDDTSNFELRIIANTHGLTNAPGANSVTKVGARSSLSQLLNS